MFDDNRSSCPRCVAFVSTWVIKVVKNGHILPRSTLVTLNMTVEEGIKLVISGGIVTPPDPRPEAMQKVPQISSREDEDPGAPHEVTVPARAVGES